MARSEAASAARAGTLFVVATPIGHLEDITLRALRTLKEVALVAAEDTRRTGNLLRYFGIATPLLSVHVHNERQRTPQILERLLLGDSVALVSDAGTPGISDPGAVLVRAARTAGIPVVPVPGPSAIMAVLSASGIPADRFVFAGFPPTRSKDRAAWLHWLARTADAPVVCFEAPHRLRRTFEDLQRVLGERPIIAARELTKVHEEWRVGNASALLEAFPDPIGEFALVILPEETSSAAPLSITDAEVARVFGQIAEFQHPDRRAAVRETAERLGLSVKAVYDAIERSRKFV